MKPTAKEQGRVRSRLGGLARLAGYCAVVGLLGAGLSLRSAYGGVMDATLELGSELGHIGDAGSGRPVLLNGQPIFVSSATDAIAPDELLDRVEARCATDPMRLAEALPRLPEPAEKALRQRLGAGAASSVVRHGDRDRGMVACFTREGAAEGGGLASRLQAVKRFVATGDLGALGQVRYVFAERTSSGRTHVVTAWSDGPFNLYDLLAPSGDAPGSDIPGVPRPEGAVRLLSATIEGVPYSVRVYRAPSGAAEILARYDADMPSRGWERLDADPAAPRRVYARAGGHVLVIPDPDDSGTLVTLVELRGR